MGTTLADRADATLELIASRGDDIEDGRRITDDVLEAIRGTGLNRSLVPAGLGGDEVPLPEVIDAVERIASADGSTGWCAAIGAGSNLFSGYVAPDVAAAAYPDPDQPGSGQFGATGEVRPGADGLVLNGRWTFSSNCLHSGTAAAGAFFFGTDGEAEPIPRLVLVRAGDLEVEDTWDAIGLRGTGSHDTVAKDLPTDREWSLTFVDPARVEGALWRIPMFCILGPVLGATPLGVARGALDEVGRMISEGAGATRGKLAEDPVGIADWAEACARLSAARAGLDAACGRAWDLAERGQRVPREAQAAVMLSLVHGCEVAVEVTSTAHRLGGGRAAYLRSPLARKLRDVHAARQHIMFGFGNRPLLGRALAGMQVFAPPFIV
jgi:indole-3-acetate monooxygenase